MTRQLAKYVVEGSKESKHKVKKARDRLYKRLKRDGQPIGISKHMAEADMLTNLKARMGKTILYQPYQTSWHTMPVKSENPIFYYPHPVCITTQWAIRSQSKSERNKRDKSQSSFNFTLVIMGVLLTGCGNFPGMAHLSAFMEN